MTQPKIATLKENDELTGNVYPVSTVHEQGLQHPMGHAWVYSLSKEAVLMRRCGGTTFTGLSDVTLSTHIEPKLTGGRLSRRMRLQEQALVAAVNALSCVFGGSGAAIRFAGVTHSCLCVPGQARNWIERATNQTFLVEAPDSWDVSTRNPKSRVDTYAWVPFDEIMGVIRTENTELVPRGEKFVLSTRALMSKLMNELAVTT